ncbi:MAG: TRAP transporter small permease subunit [Desulfosarcinaceae bacterium]|nr:TRAP transporter small permease subunit [Desulfosarcinaceae bacterium]
MKSIQLVDRILAAGECVLAVCLFIALAGILTLNILLRNLAGTSLPGTFEMAANMVLWLALVGGSLALRDQRHIKIELIHRLLPETWQRRADQAVALFGLTVMATLLVTALFFVQNEIALFGRSGWVAVIFPLFFALAAFRFGLHLVGSRDPQHPYRPEWPLRFTPKSPPPS